MSGVLPLVPLLVFAAGLAVVPGCVRADRGDGDETPPVPRATEADRRASAAFAASMGDRWRWKHRVLLVWSTEEAAHDQAVEGVREAWAGWTSRDMILVLLTPTGGFEVQDFIDGGPVGAGFGRLDSKAIATRFGISIEDGIRTALVGKDGGVKERWPRVVEPAEVFDLVDAMPMRMREMREDQR